LKSKTSLYGVSIVPRPNQPVARNVVQWYGEMGTRVLYS
jgi:hypothetical protein